MPALGTINPWNWERQFKDKQGKREGLLESRRCVESYERIAESAAEMPGTRHVCVGDRESKIMEVMVRVRELNHVADYLLRSQHNRNVPGGTNYGPR